MLWFKKKYIFKKNNLFNFVFYQFCKNNTNNFTKKVCYTDLSTKKKFINEYNSILKIAVKEYDEQEVYCLPNEIEDKNILLYVEFHAAFIKLMNKNINIIQIKGEPLYDEPFTIFDKNFLKSNWEIRINDNVKTFYSKNINYVKNNIVKDLLKINKIKDLHFFVCIPYLNNKNKFCYSIVIGAYNINVLEISNIKFNLLKNINFNIINKNNLNYEYFLNLLNMKKNIFFDFGLLNSQKKIYKKKNNVNLLKHKACCFFRLNCSIYIYTSEAEYSFRFFFEWSLDNDYFKYNIECVNFLSMAQQKKLL